jgi:hypothetical protein
LRDTSLSPGPMRPDAWLRARELAVKPSTWKAPRCQRKWIPTGTEGGKLSVVRVVTVLLLPLVGVSVAEVVAGPVLAPRPVLLPGGGVSPRGDGKDFFLLGAGIFVTGVE